MKKINSTVLTETKYIASWVIILSVIMEVIFLIIGRWNYTVLLGNILSGAAAVLNFLFMGITIQNAVEKEEKEAKTMVKASQSLRTLCLFAAIALGVALPCFSLWTVIIPLFFSRIAITMRPLFDRKISKEVNKN